jgi:putative hydrolase of the HAD superfamily
MQNKFVVIFDLDDTLIDELEFVKSGLNAVTDYVYKHLQINKEDFLNRLFFYLEKSRDKIIDNALLDYSIFNKKLLKKCISIYRLHKPQIKLKPEAKTLIKELSKKKISLYIVTDGNKIVQYNKIKALQIEPFFKQVFITYRFGKKHSKPSPYCFLKICKLEKVDPTKAIYIADNVQKDFVGIKPLGFKTIRIKQGQHKNIFINEAHEADYIVDGLNQINFKKIKAIFEKHL